MLETAIQKVLSSAARKALLKLRKTLGAGADDFAEDAALGKAAGEVAAQLLRRVGDPVTDQQHEYVSSVLLETLGRTEEVSLQRAASLSGYRSSLIGSFRDALNPLDEVGVGWQELGIDTTADAVAVMFVDALTESLHMWGAKSQQLRTVAELLHADRVRELLPAEQDDAPPPPLVRAWITIEATPPQVNVYNDGSSPIFNVVPTPLLVASDWSGDAQALIGGGPLANDAAAQISPEHGYCWPLTHMSLWGGQPRVRSALYVDFTDNAARRWRLAHDQLTELT